jgi:hypothetical protein
MKHKKALEKKTVEEKKIADDKKAADETASLVVKFKVFGTFAVMYRSVQRLQTYQRIDSDVILSKNLFDVLFLLILEQLI